MSKPPFVMSKYASELDLYKDKAKYYQERCEGLLSLFKEGFDSEENHDLDEWEKRAKKFINDCAINTKRD